MGYNVTEVNVIESDGVAQLTVAVTIPMEEHPIETSFSLLVNTLDGTATGLAWSLEFDYVLIHSDKNHSLAQAKYNIMLTLVISNLYDFTLCSIKKF